MIGNARLKKISTILWVALVCLNAVEALAAPKTTSSIAINALTGEVLSSKNPDTKRYPASLTKLMTLYITFEALEKELIKMDDELSVSKTAANRSPSRLGLAPGSTIKVKDAINAIIVKSANDCATILAEGLGYTEAEFAIKMTEVAQVLGMKNTTFKNASGLPNRAQVSTARDMAILGAALYHHFPDYYPLFATKSFEYDGKTYQTHNNILKTFEGADGLKTGYIAASGYNIITSVGKDGMRVIAVTLGHKTLKERDKNIAELMNNGLQKIALNSTAKPKTLYAKAEPPTSFKIRPVVKKEQWGVQVGAFTNYAKARQYALGIQEQSSKLSNKEINIEAAESNYAIVYRSQIVNLSKNDADEICNQLKKSNKSCIVVETII